MKKINLLFTWLALLGASNLYAQSLDDIVSQLSEDNIPAYTLATFKGTTVINGQSVEVPGANDLNFKISHRFGSVTSGIYDFFGLDQASSRFAFAYGIGNIASVSLARNSWEKTYDGGIKLRLLRQQTGNRNIPISISLFNAAYAKTEHWEDPDRENLFSSRLSYNTQLLIARKFNKNLSLQITPTYIHKNLVPTPADQNNIFATGISGRYKFTRKASLNAEYFYLYPGKTATDFRNSISIGVDLETGGHVFQLLLTNSQSTFDRGFIAETTGNWLEGDIYFGFNLYRAFTLSEKRKNIY